MRILSFATLAVIIAACQPEQPFREELELREVMLHVVEPAADVYWASVGIIIDAEGTHEIAPANSREWLSVENAAATLTEVGNLMMTPGRMRDDPRWTALAQEMITAGRQALAAADDRDTAAVFEAGGDVYVACANCHAAFAPALLPANYMPVE